MGAMNRHPSCTSTWKQTTLASRAISDGFAHLMRSNSLLEDALLAEFHGATNAVATDNMITELVESVGNLETAQALIRLSIDTSRANTDDFAVARDQLKPDMIAELWNGSLLIESQSNVCRIAKEIKADRLSTAARFVEEIGKLLELYKPVIKAFQQAQDLAKIGRLRDGLRLNEVPLQSTYALLLSTWLSFMNEYLIDSLIATQVAFTTYQKPALVAV